MLSCEFCEIFKNAFFYRRPLDDCFYKYVVMTITLTNSEINLIFIYSEQLIGLSTALSKLIFYFLKAPNIVNLSLFHTSPK